LIAHESSVAPNVQGAASSSAEELEAASTELDEAPAPLLSLESGVPEVSLLEEVVSCGLLLGSGDVLESSPQAIRQRAAEIERPKPIFEIFIFSPFNE
jgi:hypothetical protein